MIPGREGASGKVLIIAILGMFLLQSMFTLSNVSVQASPEDMFEYTVETSGDTFYAVGFVDADTAILAGAAGHIQAYDLVEDELADIQERWDVSETYYAMDRSSDGETLIVGQNGKVITVSDDLLRHPKEVNATVNLKGVSWRQDGAYATIVGDGGSLQRYYPETTRPEILGEVQVSGYDALIASGGDLLDVAWRPDDSYALMVAFSGKILKYTGDNVTEIPGPYSGVSWTDVEWAPDGSKALIVGINSNITLFDAAFESFTNLTVPANGALHAVAWQDSSTAYVLSEATGDIDSFYMYTGSTTLVDVSPVDGPEMRALAFHTSGDVGLAVGSGLMEYPNNVPQKPSVWLDSVEQESIDVEHSEPVTPDFTKYEYYISLNASFTPGPGTLVGEQTNLHSTTYTFSPLQEATTYYIIVRVCDKTGYCTASDELETSTLNVQNPPPVTLTASNAMYSQVTLEWTTYAADDFSSYTIYAEEPPGIITELEYIDYKSTTSYTATGLKTGTTYSFYVRVLNSHGYTSDSNKATIDTLSRDKPPEAVLSITVNNDEDQFLLEWDRWDSTDWDRYEIHMSTESEFTPSPVTLYTEHRSNNEVNSYSISYSSVLPDLRIYVKILTYDSYGVWSESNEHWLRYNKAPSSVDSVTAADCTAHECTVTWDPTGDKPADFSHFEIYLVEDSKEKKVGQVKSWDKNSYTVTDLKASSRYYFRVYVVDDADFRSSYKQSTSVYTEGDTFAEMFDLFGNPGCVCGGGWFAFILLLALLVNLGKKYGAKGAAWGVPLMVALMAWIGVNFFELILEEQIDKWFLWPLIIICIILSIVIGSSSAIHKAYKRAKWRREERERDERNQQENFDSKRSNTDGKLRRLQTRLVDLKAKAPYAMHENASRSLNAGLSAFSLVMSIDNQVHLDEAANHADYAERIVVDMEAYIVAKDQASVKLRACKERVDALKEKEAPRIKEAVVIFRDAQRRLEEATDLAAVQAGIERITRCNQACEESEISLKDAQTQLADLRSSLGFVRSRTKDIEEARAGKEKDTISRLKELSISVERLLTLMGDKPDLKKLAEGRELIREGKDVIQKVDDRERQRAILQSDMDSLESDIDETSNWTVAGLDDAKNMLAKARKAFDKDSLGSARASIDEGFGVLGYIKENNRPRLMVVPSEQELLIKRWEDLMIELKNDGTANAQGIDIDISSPSAQLQEMKDEDKSTFKIVPGDTTKVPVAIQFTAEGSVPVKVFVRYMDYMGRDYEEELTLRVEVVHRKRDGDSDATSARAGLDEFGLKIRKRSGISHGFYKFKVSVQNKGKTAVRDVNFRLLYNKKIFRLHHIWPKEYKLVGDSVDYGVIEPGTTTSVEFYLEAHMCTETKLDGVITFKDMYGTIHTKPIKTHKETFICPTFIDVDSITPAQVKEMVNEPGWKTDTWTYAVPSTLNLQYTFDIMKEAIEKYDPNLKHVFDDRGDDPFFMESWYYGEAESAKKGSGVKHVVIGKVQKESDVGYSLKISGVSMHQGQLFALSSRLSATVTETIQKKANLARPIQQIYQSVEIKDSVIQGSQIQMGGADGAVPITGTGKTSIKDSVMVRSDVKTGAGETEIESSVLQRTTVGGEDQVPEPASATLDPMREFAYNVYRDTLRQVYEDDIVTMDERNILKGLRKQLKISMEEHEMLEEEIIREREAMKAGKKD